MLWLKSCPKCDGDLFAGSDYLGCYITCAQCGHYLTREEEAELREACRRRLCTLPPVLTEQSEIAS